MRSLMIFCRLVVASVSSMLWPNAAHAEERCPPGYVLLHDNYWDEDRCAPAGREARYGDAETIDPRDFWGTIVSAGPELLYGAWDHHTQTAAERFALRSCKDSLKAKKIKGKCRVIASWANGDGVVAEGNGGQLFLEANTENAMGACQRQASNCAADRTRHEQWFGKSG